MKYIRKGMPWALAALMTICVLPSNALAQKKDGNSFPPLTFTKIAGAPHLTAPVLIQGATKPVMAEGMGWAAPAFYDVDEDGLKDLLIGEFGSRMEDRGMPAGSFVRVYKNEGSETAPRFSDFYTYVYPTEEYSTGTPLSVYTWCCMGFTPIVIDLDNDGYDDLVTGAYNPGFVTWFRGTENGFMAGEKLPQFGNPMDGTRLTDRSLLRSDPKSLEYWNYSSVAFGDFDGNGLYDMIVGGAQLRISKNIGTRSKPSFGLREPLLDIHNKPLRLISESDTRRNDAGEPYYGSCMVPSVADWDGDGVPDLFVTDSYVDAGSEAVTFFRGVSTPKGLRFEPGISLFTSPNGQKALPGSWPRVTITDWNNDGVNDLVIGTSVATLGGTFDHDLSWQWESENDIVKNYSAYYSDEMNRHIEDQLHYADSFKTTKNLSDEELNRQGYINRTMLIHNYYGKGDYRNLAHQGYIYVMLGKREEKDE